MLTKSNMNRLRKLGYPSYAAYRESPFWSHKVQQHKQAGLPQKCLGCGSESTELRHRSYTRLGEEQLFDLIPLCSKCNALWETFARRTGSPAQAMHKALRRIFDWTKEGMERKFAPFGGVAWVDHDALSDRKFRRLTPAEEAMCADEFVQADLVTLIEMPRF